MTAYQAASLWALWVGSAAAAAAVVVAIVFGYLTLAGNRRSKDAQQRASLAAALVGSPGPPAPQGIHAAQRQGGADFTIGHKAGQTWLLVNQGPEVATLVDIEGLTDLDRRRLRRVSDEPASLGAGQAREFVLLSRFTLSGPGNIVVSYRLDPHGPRLRRVLQVPA